MGRKVTLERGKATVKGATYRLGSREPQIADVDGDGDQDALVTLFAEEGNGYSEFTYVWLWDEPRAKAVQVRQPVTDDARCGNVTTDIAVGVRVLTVSFLDRRASSGPCASKPDTSSTKKLELKGGFLYQVKPQRTAITSCGPAPSADAYGPEELDGSKVLAAPDTDAPVIATAKTIAWWDAATDQSGVPKGWFKAMFVPTKGTYDDQDPPCGFVKTS